MENTSQPTYEELNQRITTLEAELKNLKGVPKPQPKERGVENLCWARTWSGGEGARCTRCRLAGYDYCAQHQKQADKKYLKLGDYRVTGEGTIPYNPLEKLLNVGKPYDGPLGFDTSILGPSAPLVTPQAPIKKRVRFTEPFHGGVALMSLQEKFDALADKVLQETEEGIRREQVEQEVAPMMRVVVPKSQ